MNAEQIAIAVENLILLGFLLWLLYGPWQETVTAILRSNLFKIRDEIFDMAADGRGLSFDDPAYQQIRQSINGMIRHACLFTWPRFLLLALLLPPESPNSIDSSFDQIEDPGARKRIRKLMDQAYEVVVGTMLLRSPVFMIVLMLLGPLLMIKLLMDRAALKRHYWRLLNIVRQDAAAVSSLPDHYGLSNSLSTASSNK